MATDFNSAVSYLKALKQSANTNLTSETATPEDSNSGAEPIPGASDHPKAERRRSPRYKCEGSAQMQEPGCDVRTWATFTDISLHGCYVEAQATYPAGTILHMKLDSQGVRIETKGCVRVTYPYLGMGIAFIEMSDADRTRLQGLLARLSAPSVIMGPGVSSSIPCQTPTISAPPISDPQAAIEALLDFFRDRQMLMKEDFLRILTRSQANPSSR